MWSCYDGDNNKENLMMKFDNRNDVIVFSSNHFGSTEVRTSKLMNRFAQGKRVYFIESPIVGVTEDSLYLLKKHEHEVIIIQPYIPGNTSVLEQKQALFNLVKKLINVESITNYTLWTDTPEPLMILKSLHPEIVVYDCLKTYFDHYPERQEELLAYADVVLTSGFFAQEEEADTSSDNHPLHLSDLILGENERQQA
jgi:UDP-galactopyranose mutase